MSRKLWKGIMASASLFLTCYFTTIIVGPPLFLVALKWHSVGRRLTDICLWLWFIFAAAVYELLLGVKIVIHGHPAPPEHSMLILCNHRTRLDWLFFTSYQLRCAALSQYRICLKAPLKNLPGPGWAMQCAGFLFLQRDWKKDQDWIGNSLRYFAQIRMRPQFLFFPEGTDLCEKGVAKSLQFAQENNLPMYKYVLHPRTKGFIHFVNTMKENNILDSVLDVTMAYPKNIVQSESEFGKGQVPQEVHFYAQNHLISELPKSPEKLEEWCQKVWHAKETRLERFYQEKSFVATGGVSAVSTERENRVIQMLWFSVGFFGVFMLAVICALLFCPWFKWYCFLNTVGFLLVTRYCGGVDSLLYATCC